VSYSRYNEPLADRIILRRIEQATERLPDAILHTNTNGDYLTPQYLGELADAGLRSLNIQVYLGNDDRYDHERMRTKLLRTIDQLQLNASVVRDERDVWLEATADSSGIRMRIYARNFELNGCNRGDSVPIQIGVPANISVPVAVSSRLHRFQRQGHAVLQPSIGRAWPRECHRRRSEHRARLFLVYASETMAAWRRGLIGFSGKSGHCSSCSFVTYDDTPEHRAVPNCCCRALTGG